MPVIPAPESSTDAEMNRGGMSREVELEKAEFFRALPPDRRSQVRSVLREKRFTRQRVLFFEGQPAEFLWVVRRGEVRLYKSSADGRITTLEALGPGEMFGAVSALDEDIYTASAEAVTDGVAWCLPRRVLMGLVGEVPVLAVEILVAERDDHAHAPLQRRLDLNQQTIDAPTPLRRQENGVVRRKPGQKSLP